MNQLDLTCSNRIGSFDNAVCDMHVEFTAITWSFLNHIWVSLEFRQKMEGAGKDGNPLRNYRIGKTLGIGSFGKVKIAEHISTGHKVAIKILNRRKIRGMEMEEKGWCLVVTCLSLLIEYSVHTTHVQKFSMTIPFSCIKLN